MDATIGLLVAALLATAAEENAAVSSISAPWLMKPVTATRVSTGDLLCSVAALSVTTAFTDFPSLPVMPFKL